jgi:hypothetical protein
MKTPALSDEGATIIRDACHHLAEFALEADLNTRDERPLSPPDNVPNVPMSIGSRRSKNSVIQSNEHDEGFRHME